MNDVKDFSIDIDKSWSDEEGARSDNLFPLPLLQNLNFLFRRDFILSFLWVLRHVIIHFVAHLLDLNPFLFDQFLQLFIVISFLAEFDSSARISHVLIKLKSKFNMNSNCPEVVNHNLLNVDVLKSVRIVDELSLVIKPILIFLKGVSSPSVWARTDIVNSIGRDTAIDQTTDKSNGVRSSAVDGNILRLFLSL